MNKYVIDLIQARLDEINKSIHAIKEEKNSLQESLEKTNQTDLMYARLMHSIGEEYLKLAELYAEKTQLNNELNTSGVSHETPTPFGLSDDELKSMDKDKS